MLETLLKHFRSYGMNDLEFIIVNSKLHHSQLKIQELQKRVSFGVYQETEEEEVWNLMDGGKDDMFIYDRCGRLTYFVPFPLSILNEYPLVSNAVLATYFRSPCGITCERNGTIEIGEIAKVNETDSRNETAETEDAIFYYSTEESLLGNNIAANDSSNDVLAVVNSENNFADLNLTDSVNITDYDYDFNNNTMDSNETKRTIADEEASYFDMIFRLFFNTGSDNKPHKNFDRNITFNVTDKNETILQLEDNHLENTTVILHHHHHLEIKNETQIPKKVSDRCLEADYDVCKSWSKKRLLHSQKCCSSDLRKEFDAETLRSCHHFSKRKCKKIQSILKCCIKTGIGEVVGATAQPDMTIEPTTETSNTVEAVCCKIVDSEKFCRVSETGVCMEDEFVEDKSVTKSK